MLTTLATKEAELSRSFAGEKDLGGIMARYSAYRKGSQRPAADSAFMIGEAANSLGAPFGIPWSSGVLCLFAAGHLKEFVLLVGALCECISAERLDLILSGALSRLINYPGPPDPELLPYLRMQTHPTLGQINEFRRKFAGNIATWELAALRSAFRKDLAMQRVLTFTERQHETLADCYRAVRHGATERFRVRPPLQLAFEVAASNSFTVSQKRVHIAKHFQDLLFDLYTEQYLKLRPRRPKGLITSKLWGRHIMRLCQHPVWCRPSKTYDAPRCAVCGATEITGLTRDEMLDERIARALIKTPFVELIARELRARWAFWDRVNLKITHIRDVQTAN